MALIAEDYVVSMRMRRHMNEPNASLTYDVMTGKVCADLSILGASRVASGCNTCVMDSILHAETYALGLFGSDFKSQYLLWKMYLAHNPKPRTVIKFVDHKLLDAGHPFGNRHYYPWFWNAGFRRSAEVSGLFSWQELTVPMWRYRGLFGRWSPFEDLPSLRKGFAPKEMTYHARDTVYVRFHENAGTASQFDEFLSAAESRSIDVVFVYPPLYRETYRFAEGEYERFHNYFDSIAVSRHIPVLDYSKTELCSDSTFFFDHGHLNPLGARIFSDSLSHDLLKYGVLDKH